MKVEIWSDVTCTFCYTAKQQFEVALKLFKDRDKIEVVWKSFELAPGLKTDGKKYLPQFLAELHGISLEQAKEMTDNVTNTVKKAGLVYNLDKTIPANSFNAHRLSHLAKENGLQNLAEEKLFKAYFTDGKNIDDFATLEELASEMGLNMLEVKTVLGTSKYADEVVQDIYEANQLGITSVPCYVFDSKTKVSGAQDSAVFLRALESSFVQWKIEYDQLGAGINTGQSCKIGENCL